MARRQEAALTTARHVRWRGPAVPWDAAFLLLPVAPDGVRFVDAGADARTADAWRRAATWWGLDPALGSGPGAVVLAASPEAALAANAPSVLLAGADVRGVLAAAGYRSQVWAARATAGGAVAVVAEGGGLQPHLPAPASARLRLRAAAIAAVRRASGTAQLTVASRIAGPPALATGDGARACAVGGGGGPRRRPVLLTAAGPADRPTRIVKAARSTEDSRGRREQQVLGFLRETGLGAASPQPLGQGRVGPFAWSAESAVTGRPLADLLGERPSRRRVRTVLEEVTTWLGRLAAASRTPQVDVRVVPLRGDHAHLATTAADLAGVPGVLVHGDLAAGFNLLVDDAGWTLIDWETAMDGAPPLVDLLPLLCGALAALHAPPGPAAQGQYVLRLCAGQERASGWLFEQVGEYLRAAAVPVERAGALAAVAFGYQASMRLAHQELVLAAGGDPPQWQSMWDAVAPGWASSPPLGAGWPALQAALRG